MRKVNQILRAPDSMPPIHNSNPWLLYELYATLLSTPNYDVLLEGKTPGL